MAQQIARDVAAKEPKNMKELKALRQSDDDLDRLAYVLYERQKKVARD
jgi:hypothetical protein